MVFTNVGRNMIRDWLSGGGYSTAYPISIIMGLGSTTTLITDTALESECGSSNNPMSIYRIYPMTSVTTAAQEVRYEAVFPSTVGSQTTFGEIGVFDKNTTNISNLTAYDEHSGNTIQTGSWIVGSIQQTNTSAKVYQSGGMLQTNCLITAATPNHAEAYWASSGISFPNESGLSYIQFIGSFITQQTGTNGSSWSRLYFGGQLIKEITQTSIGSQYDLSTIEAFRQSNGSWLIFDDGLFTYKITPTNSVLVGSVYVDGPNNIGSACIMIDYERYQTGTTVFTGSLFARTVFTATQKTINEEWDALYYIKLG